MQRNSKKVTILTMAERLQVSTATISNAFNRPDQLSAELREHILRECRRSGYPGPEAGRRKGRPAVLGLMLDGDLGTGLADPDTQGVIRGLSGQLDRHRYSLLLLPGRKSGVWARLPPLDGLVYYRVRADGRHPDRLPGNRVIALECHLEGCPSLRVDQYAGAHAAVLHGLKSGRCSVAILGLRLLDSDRVCRVREDEMVHNTDSLWRQRLLGYLDALESHGCGRVPERIWHLPDNDPGTARRAVREALGCNPRPELLLCMDDRIAETALEVAGELGLRVPEALRIVGFGGAASDTAASLTTLVPPSGEELGRLAAQMYFGDQPQQDRQLVPRLLAGDSCP